jgi:type II secretory pathway pseudopilin PulG
MGTAAQFGGMGMSAGGAYKSAVAKKIADNTNAQLATDQASVAIDNGQIKAESADLRTGQIYGAQRAALGANGVDLSQGSATDVLASTKMLGAKDAATIMDNALTEAWGYKAQADEYKSEANQISPWTSAIGSLLGSAGSTSGQSSFSNLQGNSSFWTSSSSGGGMTMMNGSAGSAGGMASVG